MDANELNPLPPVYSQERLPLLIEVMPEFLAEEPPPPPPRRRWLPPLLFVATCASTFAARAFYVGQYYETWQAAILDGAIYAVAVMTILLCHEMGHYLQARRYRVQASLPYFLPVPLPPIGTFGAVIFMEPRRGDRRAVFDIGISGPLAGLVPTLIFLCLGLAWSYSRPPQADELIFGSPLLVKWIYTAMHGPIAAGSSIVYHPLAFAGWVGLLITSINLMPIGQLDGGHILYGMFRRKAHVASLALLIAAISLTIQFRLLTWLPMLGLVTFLGTRHPPTADDSVSLSWWRFALGLATLAFILVGFTPRPIHML